MTIRRNKGIKIFIIFIIATALIAEIATRVSGIFDFPIYKRSEKVGYFLAPNQHGSFLNINKWYVNAEGFNNDKQFQSIHPYTILVGDSVVYGGNPIDYKVRAGTVASEMAHQDVWVAAAGGWSLYNELAYISDRKEIVKQADNLVIVFDNGDLNGLATWGGEYTHPTHRPMLAFPYIFRRYILPRIFNISPPPPELPAIPKTFSHNNSKEWQQKLNELLAYYPGKILFMLYPDMQTCLNPGPWEAGNQDIVQFLSRHSDRITIMNVRLLKGWNATLYRDSIHPNVEGNRLLGLNIAAWVAKK